MSFEKICQMAENAAPAVQEMFRKDFGYLALGDDDIVFVGCGFHLDKDDDDEDKYVWRANRSYTVSGVLISLSASFDYEEGETVDQAIERLFP